GGGRQSAGQHGARTVAITGEPDRPVAQAAEEQVVVTLPDLERSPGIRTYQATLLALLILALRLGARAGHGDGTAMAELARLADDVGSTAATVREPCPPAAHSI